MKTKEIIEISWNNTQTENHTIFFDEDIKEALEMNYELHMQENHIGDGWTSSYPNGELLRDKRKNKSGKGTNHTLELEFQNYENNYITIWFYTEEVYLEDTNFKQHIIIDLNEIKRIERMKKLQRVIGW